MAHSPIEKVEHKLTPYGNNICLLENKHYLCIGQVAQWKERHPNEVSGPGFESRLGIFTNNYILEANTVSFYILCYKHRVATSTVEPSASHTERSPLTCAFTLSFLSHYSFLTFTNSSGLKSIRREDLITSPKLFGISICVFGNAANTILPSVVCWGPA